MQSGEVMENEMALPVLGCSSGMYNVQIWREGQVIKTLTLVLQ